MKVPPKIDKINRFPLGVFEKEVLPVHQHLRDQPNQLKALFTPIEHFVPQKAQPLFHPNLPTTVTLLYVRTYKAVHVYLLLWHPLCIASPQKGGDTIFNIEALRQNVIADIDRLRGLILRYAAGDRSVKQELDGLEAIVNRKFSLLMKAEAAANRDAQNSRNADSPPAARRRNSQTVARGFAAARMAQHKRPRTPLRSQTEHRNRQHRPKVQPNQS